MGSTGIAERLGVPLARTTHGVWADPAGIRGVLRHQLVRPASVVVFVVLTIGALAGVGDAPALAGLALAAAVPVALDGLLGALGRPVRVETLFRVALIAWPPMLLVLGAAAWSPDGHYAGEIVGPLALAMSGLVALTEPTAIAAAWTLIASAALIGGSALRGGIAPEIVVVGSSMPLTAIFGTRMRDVLEGFLGARQRLLEDALRVPVARDPFVTAELLLRPLVRWTPLKNPSLVWLRDDGRAVFLAVAGDDLPASLAAGCELPAGRAEYMRRQAAQGPWITGWTGTEGSPTYGRDVAALGIRGVAYVPLVFEGRVIGVLCAGLGDRADDHSAVAEYIPPLVEFADSAAVALGPGLAALERRTTEARAIELLIEGSRFAPVFQPVRRLDDGAIVGYEALARFEADAGPERVFSQARLAGRLRDLELATLRAAIAAGAALPRGPWLSVNCSADLLIEADGLADALAPRRDTVVVELSEHEPVADYTPIADALERLGPNRLLAVDDAGAGYASLRHILEVRPSFVKLDLKLVQGVATDIPRTALVAGFVRFAGDGGFQLVAEGIETTADRDALHGLGVGLGQGYLLGRPASVESLAP